MEASALDIALRVLLLPGSILLIVLSARHFQRRDDTTAITAAVLAVGGAVLLGGLLMDLAFDRRATDGQVLAGVLLFLAAGALARTAWRRADPAPLRLHPAMQAGSAPLFLQTP